MLEWDGGWTGIQDAIQSQLRAESVVSEVGTLQNVGWVPDEGKWFSFHLLCNGKKLNILEENNTGRDQFF